VERVQEFLVKALREAKVRSSWIKPNLAYEKASCDFAAAILADSNDAFRKDFESFQTKVAPAGYGNALSQVVLKMVCPGVPDFYQGCELWDFHLVDPDNRQPVDYDLRRRYIASFPAAEATPVTAQLEDLWGSKEDGRIKMFFIQRALAARKRMPELFRHGAYEGVNTTGRRARNAVALARTTQDAALIAVVGRFYMDFYSTSVEPRGAAGWEDTAIETSSALAGKYKDILTGEIQEISGRVPLSKLLARFPAAVLLRL
jgi:(1->4)-alpha-D-glucan 1-alpha-D-glucosylmutase